MSWMTHPRRPGRHRRPPGMIPVVVAVDKVHSGLGGNVAEKGPPGGGTGDQGLDSEFLLEIAAHLRKVGLVHLVVETEEIQKAVIRIAAKIGTEGRPMFPRAMLSPRSRITGTVSLNSTRLIQMVFELSPRLKVIRASFSSRGIGHEGGPVLPPIAIQGKFLVQPILLPGRRPLHHREVDFPGSSCLGPERDPIALAFNKGAACLASIDMPVDAVGVTSIPRPGCRRGRRSLISQVMRALSQGLSLPFRLPLVKSLLRTRLVTSGGGGPDPRRRSIFVRTVFPSAIGSRGYPVPGCIPPRVRLSFPGYN